MIQDPIGPIEIVIVSQSVRDPALDPSMDFDEYVKSRDPALIKEREGMKAARFSVAPLKAMFVASSVDSEAALSERKVIAFMAACHKVTPGDGVALQPGESDVVMGGYGTRIADWKWAEKVAARFGLQAVYEVGSVAIQRARLPEGSQAPLSLSGG